MGKCKECTKDNVLSIRVTNQEKAVIEGLKRDTRKSVSTLMREAMHQYVSVIGGGATR